MAVKPIKVSQLSGYIKRILQTDPLLGNVSVIGEISNLKFHSTGHVYFTLKDENSKISCFLPSDKLRELRYELADGMEIVASGFIYLYEKGGSYSLNVRDIEVSGQGNLSIAFEKLKNKLADEGLFDEKHKKPLPEFPRKIAIVTSETGAALEDMLKIIKTRNNIVDILIVPVLVQGTGAAEDIAGAIRSINDLFPETDLIITGRGGGSIEELWAFNEEVLARSIFDSAIPVISAVGHEIDFTIADFVSDKRAETPTAAAQMAVPNISELKAYVDSLLSASLSSLENKLSVNAMKIEHLGKTLAANMNRKLEDYQTTIETMKSTLKALSPYSIMARGYGAVLNRDGILTGGASAFSEGDLLTVTFSDGNVDCTVDKVRRDKGDKNKIII